MKDGKHVVSFYRFTQLEDLDSIQSRLLNELSQLKIVGSLLLAEEGFNGSLAHTSKSLLHKGLAAIKSVTDSPDLHVNESTAESNNPVFYRLKVRVRREIVNFGKALNLDGPLGQHVDPEDWDEVIAQPDTILLDVRNRYETKVGTFNGSKAADTEHFRNFPEFVERELADKKTRSIAMFCTGGIRCEKASQWMIEQGFENVYQLKGGILSYLSTEAVSESTWKGECFVFDQRVTVDHELRQGSYEQCFACRHPLSDADRQNSLYVQAVSCPYCAHSTSPEQKARYGERGKQVELATKRGEQHIGSKSGLNSSKKSFA